MSNSAKKKIKAERRWMKTLAKESEDRKRKKKKEKRIPPSDHYIYAGTPVFAYYPATCTSTNTYYTAYETTTWCDCQPWYSTQNATSEITYGGNLVATAIPEPEPTPEDLDLTE